MSMLLSADAISLLSLELLISPIRRITRELSMLRIFRKVEEHSDGEQDETSTEMDGRK